MKMKNLVVSLLALVVSSTQAQTLEESLLPICQKIDSAYTLPTLYAESAKLELLAAKWPNEWASNYYVAYAKAKLSYQEPDVKRKDLILDQADKYFEKLKTLKGDSCEKYVLAAMLTNARLAVDGKNRWKKYGDLFSEYLNKAKAFNENNPRIYYLKGASLFYTPKMFGGGPSNSKTYFLKAKELFDKESKASPLVPYWGVPANNYFLAECEKE